MRIISGLLVGLLVLAASTLGLACSDDNDPPEITSLTPTAAPASQVDPAGLGRPAPTPTPIPEPPRGRQRHATLIEVETGTTFPLWTETETASVVAFSPDSRWLAFGRDEIANLNEGAAYRIDLRQGPNFAVEELGEEYYVSGYSPRGDLALHSPDGHPVILTAAGERHKLANEGYVTTWSPDGRWLSYDGPYAGEGQLIPNYLVDTQTLEERRIGATLPCNCDGGPRPIWAPDSGHYIYSYISGPGQDGLKTDIRDTLSGDSVSIDVYTVFGWLDATHYVRLVQNEDAPEDIASVDILTGAMQVLYGEPPGSTRFSPDWQYLAVRDDSIRRIHIRDLSGNLVAEDLRGEFGEWSADGSLLLTFAGNSECGMAALVYTVGGDLLVCAPAPSYHGQADAAISPDNRYVATISTAGGPGIPYPPTDTDIYVTDLATGVERLVAADLYGDIACIDWSPDSRFLVVGHLCGV